MYVGFLLTVVRRVLFFACACYQAIGKKYLTVLLALLRKLDAGILFVQMFVDFVDFVFVYSSDCIVNAT